MGEEWGLWGEGVVGLMREIEGWKKIGVIQQRVTVRRIDNPKLKDMTHVKDRKTDAKCLFPMKHFCEMPNRFHKIVFALNDFCEMANLYLLTIFFSHCCQFIIGFQIVLPD